MFLDCVSLISTPFEFVRDDIFEEFKQIIQPNLEKIQYNLNEEEQKEEKIQLALKQQQMMEALKHAQSIATVKAKSLEVRQQMLQSQKTTKDQETIQHNSPFLYLNVRKE